MFEKCLKTVKLMGPDVLLVVSILGDQWLSDCGPTITDPGGESQSLWLPCVDLEPWGPCGDHAHLEA